MEEVYADFGCPASVTPFVRYMLVPEHEGCWPQDHTREENTRRLMANWDRYLREEHARLFG